jgi:membrane-associated phospholipid phosphatase
MALGQALAPIDRATLAYVFFALAATLVKGPRQLPAVALLPLGLVLVGVTAACLAPRARDASPFGRFVAEFYPLAITIALYTHVGLVNSAAGVAHDARVRRWEQALFSGQPSLEWIRAFPSPAWSTVMHAAYFSYYLILPGAPLALWLSRRRSAARRTLLLMMTTFYVCYALFLCFPVEGPRYGFPPAVNAATAAPVAVFVNRLVAGGSAWGTAFPSSHVAVTVVAALCAFRAWRPLGVVLLPAALLLALATVYGQFHYAVDALAGCLLGAIAVIAGCRGGLRFDSRE